MGLSIVLRLCAKPPCPRATDQFVQPLFFSYSGACNPCVIVSWLVTHHASSCRLNPVLLQEREEGLGVGTNELVNLLAILEEGEGGHGLDA